MRKLFQMWCAALFLMTGIYLHIGSNVRAADAIVTFQAESGTLGSDWAVSNSSSPAYITILTDGAGYNPGSAARVASYTIVFPAAGVYQLYARIRVGPGTFNDDSMFYAAGFGNKSPTLNSDWIFVNGLAAVGFSNSTDVVTGGGSLGSGMWKWINLSQFTSQSGFTVSSGSLTQMFQIGARENGLDLDQFAFGTSGTAFTVSNLDTGTIPPSFSLTNTFMGPDGSAYHRFNPLSGALNLDGANPAAGLTLFGNGLCGTTLNGGVQGCGTAFYMSTDGTSFNAFRSFTNAPDAANPESELPFSGNGFFGTTSGGGSSGTGAVITGGTNGSVLVVRSFASINADNATNFGGASPNALMAVSGGMLYGTASAGGSAGNGTIFSSTTNGTSFVVLHDFTVLDSQTGTNADGAVPQSGLILAGDKLYGATAVGGAGGSGVIFVVSTNGANFTTLHNFSAVDPGAGTNPDGAMPFGGLILSSNTLYGTTMAGGSGGRGVMFAVSTNGNGFVVLHHFTATDSITGTNNDGAAPCAALLLSSNVLYGTASAGGEGAAGTVFGFDLPSLHFQPVHSFTSLSGTGTNADGAFPVASVLRFGNSLFGTAFGGGPGAVGTVFSFPIPAPPAVITNVVRNGNGSVTLFFQGGANSTNVVQAADSLTPTVTWQDVSTNVADATGLWQFTLANPTNPARFYRSYAR